MKIFLLSPWITNPKVDNLVAILFKVVNLIKEIETLGKQSEIQLPAEPD